MADEIGHAVSCPIRRMLLTHSRHRVKTYEKIFRGTTLRFVILKFFSPELDPIVCTYPSADGTYNKSRAWIESPLTRTNLFALWGTPELVRYARF